MRGQQLNQPPWNELHIENVWMKHESTSSKEFDENKQHAINENKFEQLEADNKKTISD